MNIQKFYDKINYKNISFARQDLAQVSEYIEKYKTSHPEASFEEIMESIDKTTYEQSNKYYDYIQEVSGIPFQLLAANHLTQNEKALFNIYSKFKYKNIGEINEFYSYDIKKSSTILVKSLLKILRERFQNSKEPLSKENEYSYLKNTLNIIKPYLNESYKKNNIKLLLFVKNFFDDYNLLNDLVNSHNIQQNRLWLEGLCYNMDYSEDHPNDLGVNNILSEKNLEKMSNDELAVLNMFWQNKYAKKLADLNIGFFLLQQLNINGIKTEPSDNLIKNLLTKYKFLESLSYKIYNSLVKKDSDSIDIEDYIKNLSYDYKKCFSEIMPNMKHDIRTDLNQCLNRNLALKNTYAIKSNLLCSSILNFSNNKKIKNWGYINDNGKTDSNTIQEQSPFILIGIDYPGLNKPVKIHVERELLADCMLNANSTTIIPIYEGNEDYDNNFEQLRTHIVLPFEESHKDFLRNANLNSENFNTKILRHTAFLKDQDKFPEHLKVTDKRGKKTRKRKYIDLFSGKTFVKEGKNLVPYENDTNNGLDEI